MQTEHTIHAAETEQDAALFAQKANRLMLAYLKALDEISSDPALQFRQGLFSPWFFFRKPKGGVKALRPNFRQFLSGEMTPLAVVSIRYFARLFASYHMKSRLGFIADELQRAELKTTLSDRPDKAALDDLKGAAKNLSKFYRLLSKGVRLKIFIMLSPVITFVVSTLQFLGLQSKLMELFGPQPQTRLSAFVSNFYLPRQSLLWGILIFGYAVIFVASSFIRKRESMLAHNIYDLETDLFGKRPRPREFPADIVAWCLLIIVIGTVQSLLIVSQPERPALVTAIAFIGASLYILFFCYVFYCRVKSGQR